MLDIVIREMPINTICLEWLLSKREIVSVGETVDKSEFSNIWQECKMVQLLWKTVWQLLKKLNIELKLDPAIPLSVKSLRE